VYLSYHTHLTPKELSAEPKNSASAEALTVAKRPKEESREKTRAAAGIRRFFCLRLVHSPPAQSSTTSASAKAITPPERIIDGSDL